MIHFLTIGHFDPTRIHPWREVLIQRPLSADELQVMEERLTSHGVIVALAKYLDSRGLLVIPWLGFSADTTLAETIAAVAHESVGATVADVSHASVLYPR